MAQAKDPITLVVPFASGGAADHLARLVQQTLSASMDRSVIVENRPGGNQEIGTKYVAKKTQGTVLLMQSVSLATNNVQINQNYDLNQDLQPVFYFGYVPLILTVSSKSNFYTLDDFKSSSRPLNYGSVGHGSSGHLTGAELGRFFNKDFTHIPYKGSGQIIIDLVNSNIDFAFSFPTTILSYVDLGQARAIAVVSNRRLPQFPTVPTFQELGYTNFRFNTWLMLLANQNADPEILEEIKRILSKTLLDNTDSKPYRDMGLEYDKNNFDQGKVILKSEIEKYRRFYQTYPNLR